MIAFLRGTVVERGADRAVLDVGGVGYEVRLAPRSAAALPPAGAEARLFVEESFGMYGGGATLYAFLDAGERQMFRLIRDHVPSTGAKKALEILERAGKSLPDFRRALLERDAALLTAAFGFTRKTAERLVESLRERVGEVPVAGAERLLPGDGAGEPPALGQALGALAALGYRPADARQALRAAAEEDPAAPSDAEGLVRRALRRLGRAGA